MQIYHTSSPSIFTNEDGDTFYKMSSEGIFEVVANEWSDDIESYQNVKATEPYEPTEYRLNAKDAQKLLATNETNKLQFKFVIECEATELCHKDFETLMTDLHQLGFEKIQLEVNAHSGEFDCDYFV